MPGDSDFVTGYEPGSGAKDCTDRMTWGTPSTLYSYIFKNTIDQATYPEDACTPYYHANAQIDNLQVNTLITAPAATITTVTGNLTGVASGNKVLAAFDIPHVQDSNKRIRHIVAEGPEPGIYVRGKLKGSDTIELPEYWNGLVDPETITVTLTQIGSSQDLIVESVEGLTVKIKSGTGADIHCYYEVWAARWLNPMNHNEKLLVVYEGETPDSYPGGNENFLIGGWDYDRRNPQWETPE